MFTPCWPNAGPTGGAGFACAAGTCNFICALIAFAIVKLSPLASIPIHRRRAAKIETLTFTFPFSG